MRAILRKELLYFFSSSSSYIAIIGFLLVSGFFVWVFPDTSILDYGFADLQSFFDLAPALFMLLIPAITMNTFAQEKNTGTIEMLYTKPIYDWSIVIGKYIACYIVVLLSLLPTLIYVYTLYTLSEPKGHLDIGAIVGSYIGLGMLSASLVAIGVYCSSLTQDSITAYILSLFFCFLVLWGFELFAQLPIFWGKMDYFVEQIGINAHYHSISRGIIDTRDIIYFLSIVFLFMVLTCIHLRKRKWM